MTMQEFYTKYNMNRHRLAESAGIKYWDLIMFEKGCLMNTKVEYRIKRTIQIIEEYDLFYPADFRKDCHEYACDIDVYLVKVKRYRKILKLIMEDEGL